MQTPDEDEAVTLMCAALARLSLTHPRIFNVPPMVKGKDIEIPMFTLNETVFALKKKAMS